MAWSAFRAQSLVVRVKATRHAPIRGEQVMLAPEFVFGGPARETLAGIKRNEPEDGQCYVPEISRGGSVRSMGRRSRRLEGRRQDVRMHRGRLPGVSVKTDSVETAEMLIEAGVGVKAPYFHRSWVNLAVGHAGRMSFVTD